MTEISGNIEIASDYSSFKSIIDSTAIKRIEQLQSLNFYLSENQVVYLAGPKSMGKTTLLSQFLDNNQRHSIAIFLNEGNSISLVDNDIYKDIYLQIRIYTNEFTRKDLEKDISLNDLRIIFKNLSYYLRGSNKQMFFILDGFENLSGNEIKSLEELLYNLPHAPEVKFIVSVISDEKLKQKILVKNSTTFNIPLLTEGQVQLILPEASHEQIKLILQSFHGKPDCISIIARLNKQNVTIDEILQNPSQETNALYAAEWDVTIINDEQSTLVGFLAFSNQTVRIDDICIHCDKSKNEMIEIIESISFIQITDNLIDFVSFGHKKFTKDKLKKDKSKFLNNIINSIKTKKIPSSQTNLSLYLKEVGDNKEVIEHINNKFLLDIFNNTHSINELQKNVSIALDASIEVDNNPKAIKYRHIKCAFSNISTSDLLVNELKCYLTDKDLTSAVTLIESSNSNEGKLQLYCIYCIHFKDQKLEVENDIKVKIDYLFSQININDLGDEKTLDIASDLFPVFPEKAMKLINELDSNNSSGQNKSDNAFLKLSLETALFHINVGTYMRLPIFAFYLG
jgi:energy-coupling factor transporter ATP-binding protein EcfA2